MYARPDRASEQTLLARRAGRHAILTETPALSSAFHVAMVDTSSGQFTATIASEGEAVNM
jgi:hypothetical protein